jgi:hypothetical protein
MSHQSVRFLLRDVAKSLADNIQFEAGRESEFNNTKPESDRFIWLLPLIATPSFAVNNTHVYMKVWNVSLLFMQKDAFDANAKETTKIHDTQDEVVDKFLNRLNDWSQTQQDTIGDITISGILQRPFYKDQAGIYSGWLLTFRLEVPDDFIYCTPDNIAIYNGTY